MVNHQPGAHPGGGCDGPHAGSEPVLTELFDRGVADAGGCRQIIG
jgi:hypothetical protein